MPGAARELRTHHPRQPDRQLERHKAAVTNIAMSTSGRLVFSAHAKGGPRLWDAASGFYLTKETHTLKPYESGGRESLQVTGVAVSPPVPWRLRSLGWGDFKNYNSETWTWCSALLLYDFGGPNDGQALRVQAVVELSEGRGTRAGRCVFSPSGDLARVLRRQPRGADPPHAALEGQVRLPTGQLIITIAGTTDLLSIACLRGGSVLVAGNHATPKLPGMSRRVSYAAALFKPRQMEAFCVAMGRLAKRRRRGAAQAALSAWLLLRIVRMLLA